MEGKQGQQISGSMQGGNIFLGETIVFVVFYLFTICRVHAAYRLYLLSH